MAILAAQAPPQPQQPPAPSAGDRHQDDDPRRARRASALRRARFHRADHRQGNGRGRQADRAGAVGRPVVRARVRHDSARHLPHDRDRRRRPTPSRSIAGASSAPTASSRARCGAPATRSRSRCACSTCARAGVALGRVYDNVALRNPRAVAHTISDEIHQTQANLRGVARTKLTFISDRDNERVVDTVETRNGKEVYVADYDGANQMRVTANRRLNITPSWSPDGRSIAYSSYTRVQPQIIVSNVYQGTRETLTDEKTGAYMPVFSPDGSRIAFMSQRDGNSEIYVMNRNGSGVRRLTNNSRSRLHADVVADRHADRVHVGPIGLAADLGDGHRRAERPAHHLRRIVGRPRDVVAGAVQRDRLRGAFGPGLRRQDLRRRHRADEDDHRRRRHQRKPGVFAQRPPHRVHPRRGSARRRSSRWRATARACGRLRGRATTRTRTGRTERRGCPRHIDRWTWWQRHL